METQLRHDREAISAQHRDVSTWPLVDTNRLEGRAVERYETRDRAVRAYMEGRSMQLITSEVKLSRQEILRLSKRCLTLHSDGNIWGFRALLQHQHQKPYIRTQEVRKSRHQHKGGAAGALMRLFDCHPSIRETVDQLFLKQGPKEVVQESRIQVKAIHKRFIAACKAKGLTAGDYPLNMNHRGRRALGSYLRRLLKQNLQEAAKARYGKDAARRLSLDGGGDANMVRRPYERTQFDGHRIDAFFTIELPHPSGGTQILTLDRLWILLIKDVFSRAVLGYVICISKEYSQVDVLRCVKRAVLPWTRMDLTISGLHYPEGGGFPSAVLPDYVWAVWDEFWMDNGKANLAEAVRTTLTRTIGCAVNAGPVNAPERRSIIERFFQTLEENGYHRLPSTTGSGPKDPRRNDPEKAALRYHIKFEHLEQLTDVMIAQYNGAPHSSLGCSPLERLAYCVNDSSLLPRTLSEHLRSNLALLGVPALRTIQGSLKHGKCAYVEFEGVRYSNDVLRRSPDLIGQKLSLRIDLEDLRCITAFLASGQEFGVLTAHGLWGRTPHSLEARKAINHLRIRKLIHYTDQDDPMHVYMDYLSHNAATSKEARSRYVKVKTALETTPPPTLMLTLPSATPREEESSDSDSPVTRTTFLY